MIRLVVFDLDGTLAESKSPIDAETAAWLSMLLTVVDVAVISGGDWPQFETQLLSRLPADHRLGHLSLLPTCGTKFYRHGDDEWELLYSDDLSGSERDSIVAALHAAAPPASTRDASWGDVIEDRGSQITFSALGQRAPLAAKTAWDPDMEKRHRMADELALSIPGFSVRLGGTTSIDVTKPGIDKAYGIERLREILHVDLADILFVGDALYPGGNDAPVRQAGVLSIQVDGPAQARCVIETIVACSSGLSVRAFERGAS
jgi:HAD superfamily hydrolase (TIGR01484 family)